MESEKVRSYCWVLVESYKIRKLDVVSQLHDNDEEAEGQLELVENYVTNNFRQAPT